MILSFAMERELIPQLSHYYTSEMEDRPLSPRLYHLLIREQRSNESTGISLRPILTDGCGSRAFSGHNSAGLNTPLSPLSANPDLTASPIRSLNMGQYDVRFPYLSVLSPFIRRDTYAQQTHQQYTVAFEWANVLFPSIFYWSL